MFEQFAHHDDVEALWHEACVKEIRAFGGQPGLLACFNCGRSKVDTSCLPAKTTSRMNKVAATATNIEEDADRW